MHLGGKLIGCGSTNSYLLSLAQGWGSKEEGLGLHSCVVANERNQHEGLCLFPSDIGDNSDGTQHRLGSTLHFEYNMGSSVGTEGSKPSNIHVIKIPDLHLRKEDDLGILKHCVDQFNVPTEHRFSLLTRIRFAHAFRSPRICRLYSRISILAFVVLVQSNDAHDELLSFFANEPEYTNELIRLVRSDDCVPGTIRALAMLALGAQLAAYASSHERARILSGSSVISAGGNRMMLLNVLQKAIVSLSNPSDPSTPVFVDALLQFFLLHVLSSSSSGSAIRGSGMVPPLLPLLQDSDPTHIHLVSSAVKTLQKLMEYSSQAVSLFKDLGGIELLAHRLQIEVHRIIGSGEGSSSTVICTDLGKSDEDHMYLQKRLIKFLLKTLGSATYSPANATRAHNSHHNSLLASLSLIFNNVNRFGGDIYFSAVSVMSEIIHKDPTCFPVLHELGVPESFLSSVNSGIIPSSKALICVPNGLGAICLNAKGLEAVKETAVLRFLVEAFTTRKYLVAMNEGVVLLANAVEELLRHVSSLRGIGVEIIIEIVNKLASMGEEKCKETADDMNENIAMETDLEEKANEGHDLVSAMDLAADSIGNEQFEQLSIFHVMVLVHRTMENSETCRMFVEKGGIETLLILLQRPSITQSSDGMPIALHSTVVFKGFTQHHSAPLARAFSSSLRGHLMKALKEFSSVSGSLLQDTKSVQDNGIFSSLFVVEFLLFLAASKDNRWMSALLTEFGDSSKDVLEDIGRVHREVLWQIALLEDSKVERDYDSSSSDINVDPGMVDSEEQRIGSFRQYLDPLLRRRVSGWSIESQVSDLVSIYRDLGRAANGSHRHGIDGYSTLRVAPSTRSQPSNSLDTSSTGKPEEDKQRSYYSLCHETMRSLCYHINHLFMELGKAMLLTLRRENNPVNVSPSIVSVVSTVASIVLGHLNFGGRVSAAMETEVSVSAKCRYLGKVIDFVNGIIFDRPEISNPIMVKCFFGQGVIQAILTTFEATSQLLFTINRMPASPMDMDDKCQKEEKEESDNSWISGPLASYGTLLDHLATSSSILSSSTKQLLEQPIANGSISFPQDAETFVKVLQSKVLKAVLPIWTHPHFAECNLEFITSMISIMKHVYIGVEVRNISGNAGAHLPVPPPDESAISLIVEMGFSRARAEEALRQVGTNSVEIATDWLFSHPEEPQEDDELARAVAMSLGNSDTSLKEDEMLNAGTFDQVEEAVQLPPVDEILSACIRFLQVNEPLAFPIRDLLVMICSQNDGEHRQKVLSYIIDHVKHCCMPSAPLNESMLSALFHVLALVLHEDFMAREVASHAGLVKIALDLLSGWNLGSSDGEKPQVPKWVTACLLSVDQMLQVDPKMTPGVINLEQLKKDKHNSLNSVVIDENRKKDLQSSLQSTTWNLDIQDQRRLLEICCRCIHNQLPSETMHVVLQLCSTLTKVHTIAVSFLDAGGLHALLSLPSSSLFPGFNNVAAAIIRHILEDPHTLQQAMELEIRHSLIAATNRHSNARVSPRTFVQNLSIVISRDPVVFLKAAQAVCQIEMVGDRPNIVLLKDREKERSKAKDKEKTAEKDKVAASDGKTTGTEVVSVAPGSGHSKLPDLSLKNTKGHRKSPQSFTSVIEYLLDLIVKFVPPQEVNCHTDTVPGTPSLSDMDIDSTSAKGKEKVIAVSSEDGKITTQEALASLAKTAFVIKLLTEILLTYASSIHVLLRKDAELSSLRATSRGLSGNSSGGIFHHILHNFLPYPGIHKKDKKTDGDWRHKLATKANQFLVASSVRSTEGRRRIFSEISHVFNDLVDSSNNCRAADSHMHAFVDLLNDILAARSPTGSYISAEASVTFIDVGLVRSLSWTLQVLDLDHADSPKLIPGIIKVLELVTKEHVHSAYINSAKGDNSLKLASNEHQVASSDYHGERFQALEMASQPDHAEVVADQREAVNGIQTSGNYHSVVDDMEHDRELDGNFAREAEDDFMHEASEDGTGLENENAVDIAYSERNHENASYRMDAIFRTLRNGRHGHRFNMWLDDNHQRGSSSAPAVPQGIEELLVSQLRQPTVQVSDQNIPTNSPQETHETSQLQMSEVEVREEAETRASDNNENITIPSQVIDGSGNASVESTNGDIIHDAGVSGTGEQVTEMQYERGDVIVRDVEAVSQASSGSGATLGESLRSLEVEIGSVDGHDDGDRPGPVERLPLGDLQSPVRLRRPSGNPVPVSGRDTSLESVSEVPRHQDQETDRSAPHEEPQPNGNVETDTIDPTFLEALPEELRAEVLSSRQNQVAQTSSEQPQADGDIDPEFLAALPPDIQEEVLAQQRAQRRQQAQQLEGQPVEMDAVSIIATLPSEIREEVLLTSPDTLLATLTPALVAEANMLRESNDQTAAYSSGVPPLVSRRILETLTYLARNHTKVSKLLLHLELPCSPACLLETSVQARGKAVLMEEDKPEDERGAFAIVYNLRTSAVILLLFWKFMTDNANFPFQLLNLVEVIIVIGESDSGLSNKPGASLEQQSGSENTTQDAQVTADAVGSAAEEGVKSIKAKDSEGASTSRADNMNSISDILLSIPEGELQLLCSLLAREGLSDNAYILLAEVLKMMVASAPTYCRLFTTELVNAARSLSVCAMNELNLYEDAEKALFSSSSTNGTAILRVLQALSSLVAGLHEKDPDVLPDKGHTDALSHVWDINAALEPLWLELSNCISKIEISSETPSDMVSISGNLASTSTGVVPPLSAGAQNILPYIESFFVTCEKLRPGQCEAVQDFATTTDIEEATTPACGQKSFGACTSTDEKHVVFVRFLEKHRKLLNSFIRQNPGLLEKSFSLMLKVPRFIDFDNKRAHFRSKIRHQHEHHHSPVRISVRRAYILEDSYNQLRMRSPQDLKGKLTVHFQGEEGIDAGGLTREWYQLLSRVIFDKGALLFTTVGNESTFQPNPNSVYQTEHLSYFKFVGRVVGKALFDGQLLDVHFTRSFYKHILGVKVTYHDIEAVPLEGFSALQGISGSQRFQIHKAYGSPHHLPSAHTCFNQLDLPEYTSKEQLQERLLLAIHEANEGFGFG
ncbi:hypothetical protein BHM03_00000310 [Ensete ventricosum]|uniref:HECT-type E3 ubiquitin transferase n=1 Tax=Ensete ventricosum TaxID=4639 RepID=A0A445M8H0_ENSVE|nr:hypothetical protein BHM03_00000310 [Ensete ventricosum]